jgi:hypothetical protein
MYIVTTTFLQIPVWAVTERLDIRQLCKGTVLGHVYIYIYRTRVETTFLRTRNSDTAIPTVPTVVALSFMKAVVTFRQPDVYICRLAWKFLSHGCLWKNEFVFEEKIFYARVPRPEIMTDFLMFSIYVRIERSNRCMHKKCLLCLLN